MKVLTIVSTDLGKPAADKLRSLEAEGLYPRLTLFETVLNSDLLDEQYLQNISPRRRLWSAGIPSNTAQIVEAYLVRNKYDAIVSWGETFGLPLAALFQWSGVNVPHVSIFSWISKPGKARVLKNVQSKIDRVILMSSRQREIVVDQWGVPEDKVVLLRWPVDQKFWTPVSTTGDMICSVGREMRDYGCLIDAMKDLPIPLHIAAGGMTEKKDDGWRKTLGHGLSLPQHITVGKRGFVALRDLYARSRFVVIPLVPTDTDNGATSILEAMAMGKAVICTRTDGQRDVIKEGETGLFVPPRDPVALREAILYLWERPELAAEMGRNGRRQIEQYHSIETWVQQVRDIVQEVVEAKARAIQQAATTPDRIMMGITKSLSALMFQQILTTASTFILMLFLPRYLGPEEYGRLYVAIALSAIFQIFVNYGSSYMVAKNVARAKDQTPYILVETLALRFVFGILSIAAMMLAAAILQYSASVKSILLVYGFGLIVSGSIATFQACYQGHELLKYSSVGTVVERVFVSSASIFALVHGARALQIATIAVVGNVLNLGTLTYFSRRMISFIPKVNWKAAFGQFKEAFPYFLFTVFSTIYYRIDTIMLSKMTKEAVVGQYGGAYRLFESFNFPYLLTVALYPVLSRLWKKEESSHKRAVQKSLEYVILVGVPLSLGVIWFAREIIDLFYGLKEYEPSVILLQILSAGLLFLFVDMLLGTTLMSSDKQKQLMGVSLAAIPLNVVLNLILIPAWQTHTGNGAIGAALATGITEFGIMASALVLLPKGILNAFRLSILFKSLAAGAIMALVLRSLEGGFMNWTMRAAVAGLAYITSLIFFKVFDEEEEIFLKELMVAVPRRVKRMMGVS